jgi:hypothetical protein
MSVHLLNAAVYDLMNIYINVWQIGSKSNRFLQLLLMIVSAGDKFTPNEKKPGQMPSEWRQHVTRSSIGQATQQHAVAQCSITLHRPLYGVCCPSAMVVMAAFI